MARKPRGKFQGGAHLALQYSMSSAVARKLAAFSSAGDRTEGALGDSPPFFLATAVDAMMAASAHDKPARISHAIIDRRELNIGLPATADSPHVSQ